MNRAVTSQWSQAIYIQCKPHRIKYWALWHPFCNVTEARLTAICNNRLHSASEIIVKPIPCICVKTNWSKQWAWYTLSNAFHKSIKRAMQHSLLAREQIISFTTLHAAVRLSCPGLKPHWWGFKLQCSDGKWGIWLWMSFSKILAEHDSSEIGWLFGLPVSLPVHISFRN